MGHQGEGPGTAEVCSAAMHTFLLTHSRTLWLALKQSGTKVSPHSCTWSGSGSGLEPGLGLGLGSGLGLGCTPAQSSSASSPRTLSAGRPVASSRRAHSCQKMRHAARCASGYRSF